MRTRSTVGRWIWFGQVHSKSASGLKRPRRASLKAPFDALAEAGGEFGLDEAVRAGRPDSSASGGARHRVIEVGGGVDEPELPQLITQRRRDRIG